MSVIGAPLDGTRVASSCIAVLRLPIPSPSSVAGAAANLVDVTIRGGLADRRPMPSALIDEGPQRRVHRYLPLRAGRDA